MIASINEHVSRDCDQLWSQAQWTLDLADHDSFAIANACLRDNTDRLIVDTADRQIEKSEEPLRFAGPPPAPVQSLS